MGRGMSVVLDICVSVQAAGFQLPASSATLTCGELSGVRCVCLGGCLCVYVSMCLGVWVSGCDGDEGECMHVKEGRRGG